MSEIDVLNEPLQTSSNLIEGRWQLMFTTRPGTASPIQVFTFSVSPVTSILKIVSSECKLSCVLLFTKRHSYSKFYVYVCCP